MVEMMYPMNNAPTVSLKADVGPRADDDSILAREEECTDPRVRLAHLNDSKSIEKMRKAGT